VKEGEHSWFYILFLGDWKMKNYDVRLSSTAQRASDLVIFFRIIAFLLLPLVITLHMPMYKQQAVIPLNPG
jgi:hypothetical protein